MRLPKIPAAVVAAALLCQPAAAHLPFGEEICLTSYDTRRVGLVPTHYLKTTVVFTFTATHITTPSTTVTPVTVVATTAVLTTATTLAQLTNTFSSTATQTVVATSFTTSVVTITGTVTTTTTTTPTLTASVDPNFTPYASVAAVIAAGGGTPDGSKRRRDGDGDFDVRDKHNHALNKRVGSSRNKAWQLGMPQRYPVAVVCFIFVERVVVVTTTVTAHHTQTRTASTSTSTTTKTVITTLTVVPPHANITLPTTVTTTATTVATVTNYTSTTTTTTASTAAPTVTFYPQCQSNNVIEYVGGNSLFSFRPAGAGTTYIEVALPDALSCCELCANTIGCAGFCGPAPGYTDCYIFTVTTCSPSVVAWTAYGDGAGNTDDSVVGNGNCGQASYGSSPPD